MPTEDMSVGFNTRWYVAGFKTAISQKLDDHHVIRILSAPYFIATKLEAFNDRGGEDGRTSHDFEDIVFILEQRSSIWDELRQADKLVSTYLKEEFTRLLGLHSIYEWIDSHVERASIRATNRILDSLHAWIDKR